MELFGTAPSSPLSLHEGLENLPPRSLNPPTIEPQPLESPSSQPFKTQSPLQPQPMSEHPIQDNTHGPPYEELNFQRNNQPQTQPPPQEPHCQSQHFESLFSSFEEIKGSLWNDPPNTNQQKTSIPPPPQSTTNPILPNPHHGCTQCERTIQICESIKSMLHQVQDETRFVIQHIINSLNTLFHPYQP